jgi:tetratricopeptide (TPR) repeat protein
MAPDDPRRHRYRELADQAARHISRGEYADALPLYAEARDLAKALQSTELLDEALTNLSVAYLEAGELDRASEGLREIILRSSSDRTIHHAAYNLAVALRRETRYERAIFYARLAMRKARILDDLACVARCHNLLGNIQLNLSDLDAALAEYRQALALRRQEKGDNRFSLAIVLENIGYCRLLREERPAGVRLLGRALRLAEEIEDHRCQADCLQDLSYAALLDRELGAARDYGLRALELARRMRYGDIEKNCYFLLGEAAQQAGDEESCEAWFQKLQSHYPQIPDLPSFLKAFDVTEVLNLKA